MDGHPTSAWGARSRSATFRRAVGSWPWTSTGTYGVCKTLKERLDAAARAAGFDLRRGVRVLNAVGALGIGARPRPPRDGGALSEARRPRLGRPERRAVQEGGLGRRTLGSLWRDPVLLSGRGGDQRFSGGRARRPVPALLLRAARRWLVSGSPLQPRRRQSPPAAWRHALLQSASRRVPLRRTD